MRTYRARVQLSLIRGQSSHWPRTSLEFHPTRNPGTVQAGLGFNYVGFLPGGASLYLGFYHGRVHTPSASGALLTGGAVIPVNATVPRSERACFGRENMKAFFTYVRICAHTHAHMSSLRAPRIKHVLPGRRERGACRACGGPSSSEHTPRVRHTQRS